MAYDIEANPNAKGVSVFNTIEPQYVLCDICGKSLNKKTIMRHKATHSDIRPYHCTFDQCNKSFRYKTNLQVIIY